MDNVYSTIAAELNDKLNTPDIIKTYGKLSFIDLFNNQFELITDELVIPLPAILIEFVPMDWKDMSVKTQKGDAILRIHIGQQTLADSYWNSDNKQTALNILKYVKEVHRVLHNFSGSNFNKLSRINSGNDNNHTNLNVHTIDYRTNITEIVPIPTIEKNITIGVAEGGIPPVTKGTDFLIPE